MTPNNNQTKIDMNLPNTYRVVESAKAGDECNVDPQVHPFLKPLLMRLSARNPTWEFICDQRRVTYPGHANTNSNLNYYKFTIYDGEEVLGYLTKEHRHHGDSYVFSNERAVKDRQNGKPVATKDMNKAFKGICKHFYAKTTLERLAEAYGKLRSELAQKVLHTEHHFSRAYNKIASDAQRYVVEHLVEVSPYIPSMTPETRDEIVDKKRAKDEVGALSDAWKLMHGAVVDIVGPRYLVKYLWEGDGVAHSHTSEELPSPIKQGVGMLKLVKPGEYIEGVGMRTKDDVYFVMMERPASE